MLWASEKPVSKGNTQSEHRHHPGDASWGGFIVTLVLYSLCTKTGKSKFLRFSEWFLSEDFQKILDMLNVCAQPTFSHCSLKHHFQWLYPINLELWVSSMWVCIHSTGLLTGKTGYCQTTLRNGAIKCAETWYPPVLFSHVIWTWKRKPSYFWSHASQSWVRSWVTQAVPANCISLLFIQPPLREKSSNKS